MKHAQQFICNNCKALANVQTYEQTRDGLTYCRCEHCDAKNQVVRVDLTASQPGILPVTKLIQ